MNTTRRFPTLFASLFTFGVALSCAPFSLAQSSPADVLPKRLIGDYGYWSRTQTPPYSAAQIPFQELTHINHAGVSFNADGSLSVPDGFLEPELIAKAHAAGVKVLLLIGGDFPDDLETTENGVGVVNVVVLDSLVENLASFAAEHGYDGVDIDWEYPSSTLDETTFFALMSALRSAFPRPSYVLSADVAPWGGTGYDFPHVTPLVNYYNIMTYDCAGPWDADGQLNFPTFWDPTDPDPYECEPGGSVQQAIDIYVWQSNVPPVKLNVGIPFYGYWYKNVSALFGPCPVLVDDDTDCGNADVPSENYGTFIEQRVNAMGWKTYYDNIALVPYMLRTDGKPGFITYDDPFSTYYKVWYSVWERHLGGSFMWSLDADYNGKTQPLLTGMYNATISSEYNPPPR